ncbi:two-component system alkaline phosphatase synthesis response regulator PhoP [Caldicoprobacter guelmensis]|uniref:response regulator transcription factor n=1 Tax=Caldicoprobacter guelmensis TaxID=1170224 RepID=UPI001956F140|nr:response regulator transcription factor [Caldicoprobacter guelmensis]MBM7582173.1 two-component system alkaline phosphatase synthesis response regulator PhoP [Caldicoprobacter guelmensis]
MIFFVEDDDNIRELVVYTLQTVGFEARGFENGKAFFEALSNQRPQLILLDIMLPDQDGLKVLKKLRSHPTTKDIPIIMVTAKGTEYDKVIGLDSGADDYITKPFGMMELISRIKAVLRRTSARGNQPTQILTVGPITLDTEKYEVTIEGKKLELTHKEFELLRYLMENQGIVLSRDKILEAVWGYDFDGETRTVDVHIRLLRQKLGKWAELIETIRGVGYRIGGQR